jgi:hypothetical protein
LTTKPAPDDPELTDLQVRLLKVLAWAHHEGLPGLADEQVAAMIGGTQTELAEAKQRLIELGFIEWDPTGGGG